MTPDYTNWASERQKLKAEILNDLRQFRDKGSYQILKGVYTFGIQGLFKNVGDIQIIGPITFRTAYRTAPVVTYGPQFFDPDMPFVTSISTAKWQITSGTIDGFYMAVYALTVPPPALAKHTIHWEANGIGSSYRREQTMESWQVPYDQTNGQSLTITNDKIDTVK